MIRQKIIKGFFEEETVLRLDKERLIQILQPVLSELSFDELISVFINKIDACLDYARLIDGKTAGYNISLLFNPHRLLVKVKGGRQYTLHEAMKHEFMAKGLARAIMWRGLDVNNFKKFIDVGVDGVVVAQEFAPHVMVKIGKHYGLTHESKVLDPCGGWGGRMIGVSVFNSKYEAFEPSTRTYEGLLKLGAFIKSMNAAFEYKVHRQPFEDSVLRENYYDFAVTSPPYYDTEKYTDEPDNSCNKFNTFDSWCDGFFYPMVIKTMRALKTNGCFLLNIGSRKYPLSEAMIREFGDVYQIKRVSKFTYGQPRAGGTQKGELFYELKHK